MTELGRQAFRQADDRYVAACHAELAAAAASKALRGVKAINLSGVEAGIAETAPPAFEWVDPGTLLIDEGYQRNLSERSIKLVRKICARWDWRRFKPPVCARTERGLEVIDGQHTAIAACSHVPERRPGHALRPYRHR